MKKPISINKGMLLLLCILFFLPAPGQVTISKTFRVANFWMPGNGNGLNLNQNFYGQLQLYVNQMKTLGVTHFRIGGKDYDQGNMWDDDDLSKIINWLRSHGFEVIVQVPIDPTEDIAWNAANTASIVAAMNTGTLIAYPVELWAIGNEPDSYTVSIQHGDYTTASMIANYTRACAKSMREVPNQQFIKIIGPSLNAYDPSSFTKFLTSGHNDFIGGTTTLTGMSSQTFPFIDYIAFNQYPFSKSKFITAGTNARTEVIAALKKPKNTNNDPGSGGMSEDIQEIKGLISNLNRTGMPLGIMITEANISYDQDNSNSTSKGVTGVGPGSFLGGQFWAETMAVGMEKGITSLMHWSVVEGRSSDNHLTDIGLIGKEATGTNTNNPHLRSSYHHFDAMNKYFSSASNGTFFPATVTNGSNIKAWAVQSTQHIAVMIQNQNAGSGSQSFQVKLNSSISNPGSGALITVNIPNALNTGTYASSTGTTLLQKNQL